MLPYVKNGVGAYKNRLLLRKIFSYAPYGSLEILTKKGVCLCSKN